MLLIFRRSLCVPVFHKFINTAFHEFCMFFLYYFDFSSILSIKLFFSLKAYPSCRCGRWRSYATKCLTWEICIRPWWNDTTNHHNQMTTQVRPPKISFTYSISQLFQLKSEKFLSNIVTLISSVHSMSSMSWEKSISDQVDRVNMNHIFVRYLWLILTLSWPKKRVYSLRSHGGTT